MYRTIQLKKVLTIVGVAMLGFLMVSSVQAEIIDDFETGYTNGSPVSGINGWVNRCGTGLYADETGGKDGSWGAYNVGDGQWDLGGSSRAHGLSLDAGSRLVLDVDVKAGDSYGPRIQFWDPNNSSTYILFAINVQGATPTTNFVAMNNGSLQFEDYESTNVQFGEWYHVTIDWTVNGDVIGTIKDAAGTVLQNWTHSLTGWAPSSLLTRVSVYGGNTVVIDNLVVVPEPSSLALLASGLIGLLCYAWRKRR